MRPLVIVGFGLAGACMAWHLWNKGVAFRIIDSGKRGSSYVAAGLVHPVTGKNCTVAEGYALHRAEAEAFYRRCELLLQRQVWFPMEVVRLLGPAEQKKMLPKFETGPAAEWVIQMDRHESELGDIAIRLRGGARLDVAEFLRCSRAFFERQGLVEVREFSGASQDATIILCEGAQGLMRGNPISWQHRCAKGEILTVHAPSWRQSRMITGRGWLVPIGNDCYKVGATYEWKQLDELSSEKGLQQIETIARDLGGEDYTILAHDAGIRPILRKSQPVAGMIAPHVYVLNGLGSKGSLHAPWAARALVEHLMDGTPLQSHLSLETYFASLPHPP